MDFFERCKEMEDVIVFHIIEIKKLLYENEDKTWIMLIRLFFAYFICEYLFSHTASKGSIVFICNNQKMCNNLGNCNTFQ